MTTKHEIEKLLLEQNQIAERLTQLYQQRANEDWELISWDDLESEITLNRKKDAYDNPIIAMRAGDRIDTSHQTYCRIAKFLNEEGLQIGGYWCNDLCPRGADVYIRKDRATYRQVKRITA